ncbi:MAG TPA: GtrA family protein [Gammaproteobacteria bacterium]|jgi:putative flippase GtrA
MTSLPKSGTGRADRLWAQGLRFLSVGAVNTLGTLALYQLLLFVMPYNPAYAIAWMVGLVFVNIAYPYFVYGKPRATRRETLLNSCYYAGSFGLSWGLLYGFTNLLHVNPRLSVLLVLALVVPLNFLVTRRIYRPTL